MDLVSILKSGSIPDQPKALIIHPNGSQMITQKIYFNAQILDLGVILLGYYWQNEQQKQLFALGDCLMVGHYSTPPRILKYGRKFNTNHNYQKLPQKQRTHLVDELNDCTISLSRDFKINQSTQQVSAWQKALKINPGIQFVYALFNQKWFLVKNNGVNLKFPVRLRKVVKTILRKKAKH